MSTLKKCKVVMLSTNKKSNLYLTNNRLIEWHRAIKPTNQNCIDQHLYILSDDKPEVGEYTYYPGMDKIFPFDNGEIYETGKQFKIIATTDKSIHPRCDGHCATNECVCVYPQPSESFVQKFIEEYNKGNIITDVMVEYVDIGEQYKVDGRYTWRTNLVLKVNPKDNTITIRRIKDTWTREEVHQLMVDAWIKGQANPNCHYDVREDFINSELN